MNTVLLAAGDASGDLYAADLVRALRSSLPEIRFLGLGGAEMETAGVELVARQRDLAVGGLVELVPELPRVLRAWRGLSAALDRARPQLVVLVDSSGFNIPFARRARRAGARVLYYVSPQVWAWRRSRLRKIARRVDRVAVIFPFEAPLYEGVGVPADFVGHPLIDRLADGSPDAAAARAELGLPAAARVVALLPGSRRNELRHCLPLHLEIARVLHAREPSVHFALPIAPSVERADVEVRVRAARLPSLLGLTLLDGRSLDVLRACDAALVKPGTATLEAALLERPMVIAARGHPLSAAILRRLVRVDWLGMPNLIAGEEIVPEFLQRNADPEAAAVALLSLLSGPPRESQLARLREMRARLGPGGAARRAAAIAVEMLSAPARA